MKKLAFAFLIFVLAGSSLHAANLSEFKTADELWKHIEHLQDEPPTRPDSREQMEQMMRELAAKLEAASAEFEKRYSTDERRWEAKLLRLEVGLLMAQLDGKAPDFEAALKTLQAITDAPDVSSYVKRKARAMTREVQSELASAAQLKELKSKPLELKFKTVDGAEIDLAKLRGKVVLVDFWATWCGPCVQEIPNVVATYKKYREQGFEIVGISLDQDKKRLLAFTKKAEMTWPQYFDGKVWENEISSRFGIHGIPAMWLVDKKGFLRDPSARGGNLGPSVEKLLAE